MLVLPIALVVYDDVLVGKIGHLRRAIVIFDPDPLPSGGDVGDDSAIPLELPQCLSILALFTRLGDESHLQNAKRITK